MYLLTLVYIFFLSFLFPSATLSFSLLCLIIIKWTYHRALLFLKNVNVENTICVECQSQAAFSHLQNTGLIFIWSHGNSGIRKWNVLAASIPEWRTTDKFYGLRAWNKHHSVTVYIVRPLSAMICISSRDHLNYCALCLQQFGRYFLIL